MAESIIELLTFFDDALEVRHALNVCSCHIPFLVKHLLDLLAEDIKHIRMSHKKTTVQKPRISPDHTN